jgi:hypothetical protein
METKSVVDYIYILPYWDNAQIKAEIDPNVHVSSELFTNSAHRTLKLYQTDSSNSTSSLSLPLKAPHRRLEDSRCLYRLPWLADDPRAVSHECPSRCVLLDKVYILELPMPYACSFHLELHMGYEWLAIHPGSYQSSRLCLIRVRITA